MMPIMMRNEKFERLAGRNDTAACIAPAQADATKRFWHSRTLWFNAICAALGAAEASLGLLQASLPINAYGALAFVLAVGNTALRVVTTQPLGR